MKIFFLFKKIPSLDFASRAAKQRHKKLKRFLQQQHLHCVSVSLIFAPFFLPISPRLCLCLPSLCLLCRCWTRALRRTHAHTRARARSPRTHLCPRARLKPNFTEWLWRTFQGLLFVGTKEFKKKFRRILFCFSFGFYVLFAYFALQRRLVLKAG